MDWSHGVLLYLVIGLALMVSDLVARKADRWSSRRAIFADQMAAFVVVLIWPLAMAISLFLEIKDSRRARRRR